MATHFVVPQHPWHGFDFDPSAEAENIPAIAVGQSKVVGSNRPSFGNFKAFETGFSASGSASAAGDSDASSDFSLFSAPPSLLFKNKPLPPPPFSSFSYFSFSFLNEFIQESNQTPFSPVPPAKYTSALNQLASGSAPHLQHAQPQAHHPIRELRTPSPPPSQLPSSSSFFQSPIINGHSDGGSNRGAVSYNMPTSNNGFGSADGGQALLPLPHQAHHSSGLFMGHPYQQHQQQQLSGPRYPSHHHHQQQQPAPSVYRSQSPPQGPVVAQPTGRQFHHQPSHHAQQQFHYQPHTGQPMQQQRQQPRSQHYQAQTVQPQQHMPAPLHTQQHQQHHQPQPSQQPRSDYCERSGSFSDGEGDLSGSDSDGYFGPHESPQVKAAFKNFLRQFKRKEKECGMEAARDYAVEQMAVLPNTLHWRVCLELADFLKRENAASQARKWYAKVVQLQPMASQGWLEYAKLEEECGRLTKCRDILLEGLTHCPYSESLLVKALKHEERMGNLPGARVLLSRLREESVERTWKTVLEGGLLEARAGNLQVAREVFKYLIKHVPWYGPIFNEAFRLEERHECHRRAAALVERGLEENPRYGPLWFSALRVQERLAYEQLSGDLSTLRSMVKRALACVPKELVWKIHFEHAQVEERAGNLNRCRREYVRSAYSCPQNLIWKVWLGGARTELSVGNTKAARKLLQRALGAAPRKMRAAVLLECSRLEEYCGHTEAARQILRKARKETTHEWRVFLESVLVEIRTNNIPEAIKQAEEALKIHTGTGRLWAVLIHLHWLRKDEGAQLRVFKEALQEVPKSGEVWCEGARIALRRGNRADARRFLQFAIQFTPQYGDSFIEYLRLELIEKGPDADIHDLEQMCINADPNYGFIWLQCKHHALDGPKRVLANAREMLLGQDMSQTQQGLPRPNGSASPFSKHQRQASSSYVFTPSSEQAWPVDIKHHKRQTQMHQHNEERKASASTPLRVELTCLTPLSHCASPSEKWKTIFGGDPIKP